MFERHDFVFFNRSSIDTIIKSARCVLPHAPCEYWDELFEEVGSCIPGIVRRQENTLPDFVDVGFSSPRRVNGIHYRVSASIPIRDIGEIMTPFKVMQIAQRNKKTPNKHALLKLVSIAEPFGMCLGLLGSHALQLVTGLPYVSTPSDIDLVAKGPMGNLRDFAFGMMNCEKEFQITTDTEVRIQTVANGIYDVKLAELITAKTSIVGKGIADVKLLHMEDDLKEYIIN